MSCEPQRSLRLGVKLAARAAVLIVWILVKLTLVSAYLSQDVAELVYAGF